MAVKPSAKEWTIRELIEEDLVTGLTLQFEARDNGEMVLRLAGECLPFGNREIVFSRDGRVLGAGTGVAGTCAPSWLRPVS